MARVQVVVPNRGQVDTRLMVWLMQLMQSREHDMHYAFPIYSPIASARNRIAREFVESPARFEWLLMIDSDVVPETNPLDLIAQDKDVIGQICPIWKGDLAPGREVMWNVVPLEGSILIGEGLAPVQAVGSGCLLIARRVLEHPGMRAPFTERYDEDGVLTVSEDVSFCQRARAAGYQVWADLGGRCSHNRIVDLRQVGNAILTRHEQPILSPRLALEGKRLIFCLSPGRCGTQWLAEVFRSVRGVCSFHEPQPDFAVVMRSSFARPEIRYQFWLDDKLPAIASAPGDVYLETSHVVGNGFVEPLLDIGVVPDAIQIDRAARDVALSYWRRNTIPGRTETGRRYLVQPDDPDCYLPIPDWSYNHSYTDYQLCYWYALEQMERNRALSERLEQAGARVVYVWFQGLVDHPDEFGRVLDELGLADRWDRAAFGELDRVYNANPPEITGLPAPADIDDQESALLLELRSMGLWD